MDLTSVALAHMRRHLGRSVLVVVGLATAVAAFVAVLSLIVSLQHTMDDQLARYGASITLTPADPELNLTYGGVTVATAGSARMLLLDGDVAERIRAIPSGARLTAVIPIILDSVTVAETELLALGTDLAKSVEMKPWWHVEGAVPAGGGEVLLGLNARNKLGVETGDTVRVDGADFRVSGVLRDTGGPEDNAVLMAYADLTRLSEHGDRPSLVEITASDSNDVERIVGELEQALPGTTVASVKKSLQFNAEANSSLSDIGLAAAMLIAVVAVFVVVLTMLAAVRERQREIGVLRAVGYRRRDIYGLMFRESLLLSAVSAVVGIAVGLGGGLAAPRIVPSSTLQFSYSAPVIIAGAALAILLGVLATAYPATLAARLDPALALKKL